MFDNANVAPRVGAWIETFCSFLSLYLDLSHPVWVRGLKQNRGRASSGCPLSHPVWVRGLKLLDTIPCCECLQVAPRVGAWIETRMMATRKLLQCRTPCGCVD